MKTIVWGSVVFGLLFGLLFAFNETQEVEHTEPFVIGSQAELRLQQHAENDMLSSNKPFTLEFQDGSTKKAYQLLYNGSMSQDYRALNGLYVVPLIELPSYVTVYGNDVAVGFEGVIHSRSGKSFWWAWVKYGFAWTVALFVLISVIVFFAGITLVQY